MQQSMDFFFFLTFHKAAFLTHFSYTTFCSFSTCLLESFCHKLHIPLRHVVFVLHQPCRARQTQFSDGTSSNSRSQHPLIWPSVFRQVLVLGLCQCCRYSHAVARYRKVNSWVPSASALYCPRTFCQSSTSTTSPSNPSQSTSTKP